MPVATSTSGQGDQDGQDLGPELVEELEPLVAVHVVPDRVDVGSAPAHVLALRRQDRLGGARERGRQLVLGEPHEVRWGRPVGKPSRLVVFFSAQYAASPSAPFLVAQVGISSRWPVACISGTP